MDDFVLSIMFSKTFSPLRERELEAILSLGNGYIGTRNSLEEHYPDCTPGTFIANMYTKAPEDEYNFLLKLPDWTRIRVFVDGEMLDLRNQTVVENLRGIDFTRGISIREWINCNKHGKITKIKIIKYISINDKKEFGKIIELTPENYTGNITIITGLDYNAASIKYLLKEENEDFNGAMLQLKTKYNDKELKIYHKSTFVGDNNYLYQLESNDNGSFERFEWQAGMDKTYWIKSLCSIENYKNDYNLDNSIEKHLNKWQERWNESKIVLSGSKYDQKLVDFAVFHLINSGEFSGYDCSIPARNLSGEAYKGHVFWDTEIYLLPFYILTKPECARALLMYRYNTLPGARQNAINEGKKGASYAWESTDTGIENAPQEAHLPDGQVIQILSGKYENHISSDIAYSVWKYWEATQDTDFIIKYGAEIIFETARYCETLISKGDDGLYHINSVIGPDEYHEIIDDSAYTNYLVKNNFDVALKSIDLLNMHSQDAPILGNLADEEIIRWKDYRDNLYSGLDPATGLFEQFKGYYNLEEIDLTQYEPRSVPMDIILGRERTQKSQVIKQADVLMFMFLFGERFSKEQLTVNYKFYEPRCGHGSSLSPSIHSIIAARCDKTYEAYDFFRKNAQIDIGDAFGNAAGGIHIAALGGVWMSVVMGFAGLCYTEKGFSLNPDLPEKWDCISFSINWRGVRKDIFIDHKIITINGENYEREDIIAS